MYFRIYVRELNVINNSFYTHRKDNWTLKWFIFGGTFLIFASYSILVILFDFPNGFYTLPGETHHVYASPFYGPEVFPVPFPFALLTLWIPFGFRGTCYYMRRVYYRSFFQSPPACTVTGINALKGKYSGETRFPWWINHLHRYFLYGAILLGIYHWYEAVNTLIYQNTFYLGFGCLLAFADAIFLTFYVISCHAFRNLFGGGTKRQGVFMNKVWSAISKLNKHHGLWFWCSLLSIWAYDLYIRLITSGILQEMRLFV